MSLRTLTLLIIGMLAASVSITAQDRYRYSVNLNDTSNDRLRVVLECPTVTTSEIRFFLPKIVPGTYMNSNFGKYAHNLKAIGRNGENLPIRQLDDNSWRISQAAGLKQISYEVEDTWDATIDNPVYPMVGTSFEGGKAFVLNTCGVFGYLEGMKRIPFELNFTKPAGFYGASGLKPTTVSTNTDQFICENADHLYDSPIMYSLPDTTTMQVGGSEVLIAVYSPHKLATSRFIAQNFEKLMLGTRIYLKGKLPVDKYAFIFYFNGEQPPMSITGAWEHSYSSFYAIAEEPQEQAIQSWIDISAHEFFHIVTPLTISSNLVKEFNFNETVMSKHLWLYEGSTEYYSHHMQVWTGLKSQEEFLETLASKINLSRTYFNDTLPFAELSRESAGKWHEQFTNVYLKGAVMSACIDLYLRKLSAGQYGIKDLKHDLGVLYGKDRFFQEDELFDAIAKISYPQIREFLVEYVDKANPIPYEKFFGFAGINYLPVKTIKTINLGGIAISENDKGALVINTKNINDFGRKLGYKDNDELISINGQTATSGNLQQLIQQFANTAKEGDPVKVQVRRKSGKKKATVVTLESTVFKSDRTLVHVLEPDPQATPEQLNLRAAWLGPGKM